MRRRAVGAAALAALVIVAVGAWAFWPRGTTAVSERDALADFRQQRGTTRDGPADEVAERAARTRSLPDPGVYTFRASGEEEVKLGPLPTETRSVPERVIATVVDAGDGCFELTVSFFEEHTETTRYCTSGGSLALDAHTKHQRIGALSPTAEMSCDPAVLLSSERSEHELSCELELSGGPRPITAALAGTARAREPEELTVGGVAVAATPLTVSYAVTGDLSGSWTETLWADEVGLPLRIERSLDLSGPATFTERSRLDIEKLAPAT